MQKYIDFAGTILFVLWIPGPRQSFAICNGASENSVHRALVTLHDCLFDAGLLLVNHSPVANGLVGDPPLDRAHAVPSSRSDRDLGRLACLA